MEGSCSLFFRDTVIPCLLEVSEILGPDHMTRDFPHNRKPDTQSSCAFVWSKGQFYLGSPRLTLSVPQRNWLPAVIGG